MASNQDSLTIDESQVVADCLAAAAFGAFFPDGEFEILFGVSRDFVANVATAWPDVDLGDEAVQAAVIGSMNHLLGYPHRLDSELATRTGVSNSRICEVLKKIVDSFK